MVYHQFDHHFTRKVHPPIPMCHFTSNTEKLQRSFLNPAKFDLEISKSPACQQLGSYHLGATSCNDSLKSSVTSDCKMQNDAKSFNCQDLAIQWIINEEILQIFRSSKGCTTRWNCMWIGRSCDFWGNFSKQENSADQSLVSKSRKCLTCAGQTIQIQSTTKS